MTSRADRERHVAQMLTNHHIEGIEPDEADKQLQAAYIDGTVTLDDMLTHAKSVAANAGGRGPYTNNYIYASQSVGRLGE